LREGRVGALSLQSLHHPLTPLSSCLLRKKKKTQQSSPSDAGVSAFPSGDSLFAWTGTIEGPQGTAYEGITYRVALTFPLDYPFKPPSVRFDCPCFHPNVDAATGAICLDILQDKWSAAYSVRTVLLSLQSLLGDANLDSPLDVTAARHYANQADFRALLLSKKAAGQQGI
jgi:ubiquitin-conjugating enzyme E2 C